MFVEYLSRKRGSIKAWVGKLLMPVVTVMLLVGMTMAGNVWAGCTHWNLADDLLVFPNQKNPNPDSCGNQEVWHFMQSASLAKDPATYSLLQNDVNNMGAFLGKPELHNWGGSHSNHDGNNDMPIVFKNSTANTLEYTGNGNLIIPPNTISVHPASDGLVVVGWHSPIDGVISITGSAGKLHYGNIEWSIDKGTTNLASGILVDTVTEQPFQLTNIAVSKGEFIYFSVSPYDGYYADSTKLDISIDAVVETSGCDNTKHAVYSVTNNIGKLVIPFVDIPLLNLYTQQPTGELAVFSGELKQVGSSMDFGLVSSKLKLIFLTTAADPCHAVYDETQKTLHAPFVDVGNEVYDVKFQHLKDIPLELGVFHLESYDLVQ
jgi:hypothetical protein